MGLSWRKAKVPTRIWNDREMHDLSASGVFVQEAGDPRLRLGMSRVAPDGAARKLR